jgi:hypothetical protein
LAAAKHATVEVSRLLLQPKLQMMGHDLLYWAWLTDDLHILYKHKTIVTYKMQIK